MGWVSHAFLEEETWLNLYNTLDEGYTELEKKNFEYELSWTDKTIKDKVNSLLKLRMDFLWEDWDCIEGDLAPSHIEEIAKWDIKILYEKIWDKCKDEDNAITIATLWLIKKVITDHYNTSLLLASEKSSQMQKIWSVGLYSDGVTENASFDLIDDLEKIDAIIFSSKITYDWAEYENMNDSFNEKMDKKKEELEANTVDPEVIKESTWEEIAYSSEDKWWDTVSNLWDFNTEYSNQYACIDENSDHGFNWWYLESLTQNEDNEWNILDDLIVATESSNNSNSSNSNNSNSPASKNEPENITGNYKKVNDNAGWPCSDFFCIMVDFQVHQQQLLWWWNNITIEYLLDRSNKHLRKFANSSLIPAQMTTQNFELAFKNLNLADLFHMSFQIQTKPVPILSLEDESKEGSNEFKSTTLLEKYYKAYNLDYKRRNDIVVFEDQEKEYKTLLNSWELRINAASKKDEELQVFLNKQAKQADLISQNIYKKWSYETLGDFWDQFIELNNFTVAIKDHSQTWLDIMKAMDKIPTQ